MQSSNTQYLPCRTARETPNRGPVTASHNHEPQPPTAHCICPGTVTQGADLRRAGGVSHVPTPTGETKAIATCVPLDYEALCLDCRARFFPCVLMAPETTGLRKDPRIC